MQETNQLRYIDLFAGCGGLSLGLAMAGWKGLFAIEKSKDAFSTLKYNLVDDNKHFDWPKWLPVQAHSITNVIDTYQKQLAGLNRKVDLVTGGPPCQGFSMAGLRIESDLRNGLVKHYLKFISLVEPKIIFFENVKGFTLKFDKNKTKGIAYSKYVESGLEALGYVVKGAMVDFSNYGLPQKRTRFILIGVRLDLVSAEKKSANTFFEILKSNKASFLRKKGLSQSTTLARAISDLLSSNGKVPCTDSKNFSSGIYSMPTTNYQRFLRKDIQGHKNKSPDSHRFVNHRESTIKKFKSIVVAAKRGSPISNKIKKKLKIKKHTTIPLSGSKACPTLTTLPDDYIHYLEPRILTVREYARIQSFPDSFQFKGKYTTGGKLRTKEVPRYTQVGNAIPPLFGEQTGAAIISLLNA